MFEIPSIKVKYDLERNGKKVSGREISKNIGSEQKDPTKILIRILKIQLLM